MRAVGRELDPSRCPRSTGGRQFAQPTAVGRLSTSASPDPEYFRKKSATILFFLYGLTLPE
jgi:hypothetical protein